MAATGEGVVADVVFIRHQPAASEANFTAGPIVRITNTTAVAHAEVRMPIAESVDLASDDVAIYKWDPDDEEGWVRLETTIDRRTRTATANVSSFSYFAVFDVETWEETQTATAQPGWPALAQFEDLEGWSTTGNVSHDGETVTVRSEGRPGAGGFEVVGFDAPAAVAATEGFVVTATIENTGAKAATQAVTYSFNGFVEASKSVSLAPGERTTVRFAYVVEPPDGIVQVVRAYDHAVATEDDVHEATIRVTYGDDGQDEEAAFEVSEFGGTHEAMPGAEIRARATVTNTGGAAGKTDVIYRFDGEQRGETTVALEPGDSTTVTFTWTIPSETDLGSYSHSITAADGGDSASGSVYVYIDDRIVPFWPVITGADADAARLCLPGDAGNLCSVTTEPGQGGVTGHYGAATSDPASELSLATEAGDNETSPVAAKSALSRALSLPDAGEIPIQVRVRADTDGEGDLAKVVVQTDSDALTVAEWVDGDSTDGWVTVEYDAWPFRGKDTEVVVRTSGNATVKVDCVSVMIDSTDDGIPDTVKAMDLRMPVGPYGVVGTPLNLDPQRADTSGDGILDAEQVDVAWAINGSVDAGWHLEAEVLHASAHPGRVDTTGDGLTDRQQIEGWEIQVVDDHDDAEALMEIVNDPDAEADPSRFFTTRDVGADPLAVDTDGDGLRDAREFELGTDPERADTTGDGVNDRIALTRDLEDPTVFTTTAPQAQLLGFTRWSSTGPDGPQWFFQYHYKVEDPAGVALYKLSRKGMTVGQGNGWGAVSLSDYDTFESLSEGGLSVLRASQVNIETTDVHGNTWTRRLHSHTSVVGSGLVEFSPAMAGTLSGFTHGAAELPDRSRLGLTTVW